MNSRVGRLGGHSHDSRNLTFLFRSREATTHRVYLNEVDTPLSEDMIRKLTTLTDHLLASGTPLDKYQDRYNPALRTAMGRFREWWESLISQLPKLTITFYCASKSAAAPNPNVQSLAKELEDKLKRLHHCSCSIEFVNSAALIDLAQQDRRKPLRLKFSEHLSSSQMGTAYVCLVPIEAYVDFITGEDGLRREYILAPNLRGYLGDKGINQQIRDTLAGPQGMEFWWLNNGVTIVASVIHPRTRELTLEEPRIVNGLQTSREIYEYSRTNDVKGDPRHVVVRVIETSDRQIFRQSGVSTSFRYTLWVVASRLRNRNVRLRESCEWPPSRPTREFIAVAAFGRQLRESDALRSPTPRQSSNLGIRFLVDAFARPQHLVAA